MRQAVDVSVNIFAKPYQTALALLSLLKYSGERIGRIYLQFEPKGSHYDKVPPYAVAEYLQENGFDLAVHQPLIWLECASTEPERLVDPAYRLSIRYQHAFEASNKKYLFIMHNDVLITKDIIGALLDCAEKAGREDGIAPFVLGRLGQCWVSPARYPEAMQASGLADLCPGGVCGPEYYQHFRPSAAQLQALYRQARQLDLPVRHYPVTAHPAYAEQAWPLPECRVNEWGCLVDVEQTRPLVAPFGDILPFGSFEDCGGLPLDTSIAWFRELSRRGLKARHLDISPYQRHWGGNFRMRASLHVEAEAEAHSILDKIFPDFVNWCRRQKNGLF